MGLFPRSSHAENANLPEGNANAEIQVPPDRQKDAGVYDDTPVSFLSPRSLAMGVLVSMGGFIFGYDTGTAFICSTLHDDMRLTEDYRADLGLPCNEGLPSAIR